MPGRGDRPQVVRHPGKRHCGRRTGNRMRTTGARIRQGRAEAVRPGHAEALKDHAVAGHASRRRTTVGNRSRSAHGGDVQGAFGACPFHPGAKKKGRRCAWPRAVRRCRIPALRGATHGARGRARRRGRRRGGGRRADHRAACGESGAWPRMPRFVTVRSPSAEPEGRGRQARPPAVAAPARGSLPGAGVARKSGGRKRAAGPAAPSAFFHAPFPHTI